MSATEAWRIKCVHGLTGCDQCHFPDTRHEYANQHGHGIGFLRYQHEHPSRSLHSHDTCEECGRWDDDMEQAQPDGRFLCESCGNSDQEAARGAVNVPRRRHADDLMAGFPGSGMQRRAGERACPCVSWTGIDQTPSRDPAKVWRCDSCGRESVRP